jgi:hypothetical protein
MAGLRTAAQIQEEYDAVRTAYLAAVGRKSYTIKDRQMQAQEIDKLAFELQRLSAEYTRISGGGITIKGATPI